MLKSYLKKYQLEKKKAFVVGGLGLIGKEITLALESVGAEVFVLELKQKKKKFLKYFKNKKKIHFIEFNAEKIKSAEKLIKNLVRSKNCPNIFINCSYPRTKNWGKSSFKNIILKNYEKNIQIQLNSYVWLSRIIANEMIKHKVPGSIILLSSIYGLYGQDLNKYKKTNMNENMTYPIIKSGVINFARQMCSYYGKYNIRVNTVCPGGLEGHAAGFSKKQNPTFLRNYLKRIPLKKMCKPQDVASAVLFLSSEASSYISGSNLVVDGGLTAAI